MRCASAKRDPFVLGIHGKKASSYHRYPPEIPLRIVSKLWCRCLYNPSPPPAFDACTRQCLMCRAASRCSVYEELPTLRGEQGQDVLPNAGSFLGLRRSEGSRSVKIQKVISKVTPRQVLGCFCTYSYILASRRGARLDGGCHFCSIEVLSFFGPISLLAEGTALLSFCAD